MRKRALCLVTLATAMPFGASAVQAGVVTFTSDAAFLAYQSSGAFLKTFGGNVRWGNGEVNGDWEYSIVNAGDIPIGAVGQSAWSGSNQHALTFFYDGAGSATLTLGGIGSITRTVPGGPTSLLARVRDSVSVFSTLASLEVDLAHNGAGVDYSFNLLTGDADAEYWGVVDDKLALGFTATALASLDGPRTAGSDPMYQFKVGVPAPSALVLIGLGGLTAIRRRR